MRPNISLQRMRTNISLQRIFYTRWSETQWLRFHRIWLRLHRIYLLCRSTLCRHTTSTKLSPYVVTRFVFFVKDEEAMEFSALAKAFSSSDAVCQCILKSDFLKVGEITCM